MAELEPGCTGEASSVLPLAADKLWLFEDSSHCLVAQIWQESTAYPETPIGRGTAYAFQRELDSAISDFTKVEILNSELQ
ncbi:hypothetical protein TRIUR3_08798 [Triticum urartu]|uniref:Uncharacterized protein n=1 Tax=Triticum urartu TaxID=4572 RepID=M7ZDK0_TRIUA|nr:hypothetical protein TRIUR3_08798 [Triticum urartu]